MTTDDNSPLWSNAALVSPVLLLGALYFLSTPQGQAFNERVFGRLFTLGALLMLGSWGIVLVGLFAFGVGATVMAWKRREEPAVLRKFALVVNVFVPVALFLYYSYS
jgi:hypothetical protein